METIAKTNFYEIVSTGRDYDDYSNYNLGDNYEATKQYLIEECGIENPTDEEIFALIMIQTI